MVAGNYLVRGRWMPPQMRGYGLGVLDYNDLMNQARASGAIRDCAPTDVACVSNNQAAEAAVEDYWASHQSTGVPDGTVLSFAPQTAAEVTEFYNPKNPSASNIVDERGVLTVSSPQPSFTLNHFPTPLPPAPVVQPPIVPPTPPPQQPPSAPPQQQLAPQAPGAPALSPSITLPAAIDGFNLSSIPWWGYAAAAGALLFFVGGKR